MIKLKSIEDIKREDFYTEMAMSISLAESSGRNPIRTLMQYIGALELRVYELEEKTKEAE